MLIESSRIIPNPKKYGRQFKIVCVVKCDTCGEIVEKFPSQAKKSEHFCSLHCANLAQKSGGVLFLKKNKNFQEKYGVDNPFQAESVKETSKSTSLQKYGTEFPQRTNLVKERVKQTCQERYGVSNPFQSKVVQEKARLTNRRRYGVDSPMQSTQIRKKAISTIQNQPVIFHWKTNERLLSQSGYEYATLLWLNKCRYDFDWQIAFETQILTTSKRSRSMYIIDLYIKDGPYTDTYVEIKGMWTPSAKQKWDWFHMNYPNSVIWSRSELQSMNILKNGRLNPDLFNII